MHLLNWNGERLMKSAFPNPDFGGAWIQLRQVRVTPEIYLFSDSIETLKLRLAETKRWVAIK